MKMLKLIESVCVLDACILSQCVRPWVCVCMLVAAFVSFIVAEMFIDILLGSICS